MERRNKKIRTDKQPRSHLAEEIIEEVLSRLPVKSLLRFQLVSKSWTTLIGSERFIKAHLQNSRENADLANHRVIYDYLRDFVCPPRKGEGEIGELKQYSVHSLMNDPVPDPSGLEHLTDFGVVGCCNGILCVRDPAKSSFYLWNPATRIWIELPKLERGWDEGSIIRSGFGWDESSGAYKVYVFLSDHYGLDRPIVYRSNTNKWERVETNFNWGMYCGREDGVLVNGKLHWHCYADEEGEEVLIVSLDLKSEVIGSMEHYIEEGRDSFQHSLGVVGGCLCEVQHRGKEMHVWVMKEYGVKESWYSAMAVDLLHFIGPPPYYTPNYVRPYGGIAKVLGQGPQGEILISFECFFLAYHPNKDTMTLVSHLKEIKPPRREYIYLDPGVHMYFETLLSPTLLSPGPNATATFKNRLGPNATLKNRFLRFIYYCVGRLL